MTKNRAALLAGAVGLAVLIAFPPAPMAEEIEISNYGVGTNGMPYGVAWKKGFFKEVGIDVTGIRSSPGGAPTIRNMLAGNLAFAEAGLTAILAATRGGADIKIISGTTDTTAEIWWVVMPDSPVKTIKDLKGRKLGFTNPNSTTHALALMLLEAAGYKPTDATTLATGGFGPGLAALEKGELDCAPFAEPLYAKAQAKYRLLVWSTDVLPAMVDTMAITTERAIKERPDFLKNMLAARRKAVAFMAEKPREAAEAIAADYKIDVAVAETVIRQMMKPATELKIPHWGMGKIYIETLDNLVKAQKLLGHDLGKVDWSTLIDQRFLPPELRIKL